MCRGLETPTGLGLTAGKVEVSGEPSPKPGPCPPASGRGSRDAGRSRTCPRSASCTGTNPWRLHPSSLAASICTGSSIYFTPIGFALIYFHVTAVNFALVWPLKVTACRRHLFVTTTGICCPRARASPQQLRCAQGQKAARRCPCCNVGCLLQPKLRPFCARCHTDTHWLCIKMGFTGYPLRFRCRQPRAVFSRSLRCVGRFYFQAESSTAKVSLHYSVNREMRLPSRGTAVLGGPHGSCQGVPGQHPPPAPSERGRQGRRCLCLLALTSERVLPVPRRAGQMW